jgi:hypothetical protein
MATGRMHVKFYIRRVRFYYKDSCMLSTKNNRRNFNVVIAAVSTAERLQPLDPARSTAAAAAVKIR